MATKSRPIEGLILLFLLTLSYWVVDSAILIHSPVANDHTVHLTKLAILQKQIVTEHRWWGWTMELLFGYPLNYTYPSLGYALILLIDLLVGSLVSLETVYTVFLHLIAMLVVGAVYAFTWRVGGRLAGSVAALLTIYDVGGAHYGGAIWYYNVGVWACQLAVGFHLCFLYFLVEAISNRTLTKCGLAGIFLGLSILAHPLAGVASLLAIGSWCLCLLGTRSVQKKEMPRFAARLILILGIGYSLSAVWILPYLSVRDYAQPFSKQWISLPEILSDILGGRFAEMSTGLLYLGCFGGVYCLSRADIWGKVVPVYALVLVVFGSTTFLEITGLMSFFEKFEFIRLQIFVRPLFAISGGALVGIGVNRLSLLSLRKEARFAERFSRVILWVMGVVVCAVVFRVHRDVTSRLSYHNDISEPAYSLETRQLLMAKIKDAITDEKGFYRIHMSQGEQKSRALWDMTLELGVPVSFEPFFPVTNVRYGNARGAFRHDVTKYGVRYFISQKKIATNRHWRLVSQAGPWFIYRFNHLPGNEVVRVWKGQGQIHELKIGSNDVSFRVSASSVGEVGVFISPFSRWQLYLNGIPTPWKKLELRGYPDSALILPLASGNYRLVFETGWPERIGALVSLLGLLVGLACLARTDLPGIQRDQH